MDAELRRIAETCLNGAKDGSLSFPEILGRLGELRALGRPLLLGASRKSVIAHVLDGQPVEERLEGTLATTALAVWQGVEIVRVHDVLANARAARMAHAIRAGVFPAHSLS